MKQSDKKKLIEKIASGVRIEKDEACDLFSWNIIELGKLADERRRISLPSDNVGFILDRIINFTNICVASCRFCAYHARAGIVDPYELSVDEVLMKVNSLAEIAGTQVMLQGGLHPGYDIENYISIISSIREKFPDIYLHSLSPAEIVHISRINNITYFETLKRLKHAGLNSVPGASDLLVDRIRKEVSPKKLTTREWRDVMYALKENEMGSTATMTYGMGETTYERIEHLNVIRDVQDETGILRAFIPWSFSPAKTSMNSLTPATGIDYLKIVAISRIFLDNIYYIQAGWLTEGLKLAQVALTMGANDMGGVLMEEVVVKATGVKTKTNMEEMIHIIKNAGKFPVQRDSEYKIIRQFN